MSENIVREACNAALRHIVDILNNDKAREGFYAERAKENGDKDRYLQHFWQGVAYGVASRKIESILNAPVGAKC